MYATPLLGYGYEFIRSLPKLRDAIRRRQENHPHNRIVISLAGEDVEVNLFPNGFIGCHGEALTVDFEKRVEDVLLRSGIILKEFPG